MGTQEAKGLMDVTIMNFLPDDLPSSTDFSATLAVAVERVKKIRDLCKASGLMLC